MIGASGHTPTLESAIADFRSLREWRGSQVVHVFRWRSPRSVFRADCIAQTFCA
jgi:hypothetical protein